MKKFSRQLASDSITAFVVFLGSLWIHNGRTHEELKTFGLPALCFYGFHIFISLINRKYEYRTRYTLVRLTTLYNRSWLISTVAALLVLVIFDIDHISRQMIFTNLFGLIAGEYLLILLISLFRESVTLQDTEEIAGSGFIPSSGLFPMPGEEVCTEGAFSGMPTLLKSGKEAMDFVRRYTGLTEEGTLILDTSDAGTLLAFPADKYHRIIIVRHLNRIPDINRFLTVANSRLQMGGMLLVFAEITEQRKTRIMRKFPPLLNKIYYIFDYILMRAIPNLPPFRHITISLTKGQSKVISRTEVLGRLAACGFSLVKESANRNIFCYAGKKSNLPIAITHPPDSLLIHLNRIGKDGKMLKMYKLRTMHPYSEYIQDYAFDQNKLTGGGKINNDFRVTAPGKFLRRYWIDELPGLWNWLRGDVKLVGVRPLSRHYYNLYTPELQRKRIRFKPGLIPPYYADLPVTLDEIMASELLYLERYEKAPVKTDLHYFLKALVNIVFKGARSR